MTTQTTGPFPADDRKLSVERQPLQLPDRDRLVRRVSYGGPTSNADARLFVDVATVRQMLSVAESSLTNRAVIHGAGVVVDLYEAASGHRYECWRLVGSHMEPEPAPFVKP